MYRHSNITKLLFTGDGLNIYEIKDRVLDSQRRVYSLNQLSRLLGIKPTVMSVYSQRLVKKGLATKIRSQIVFTNNDFVTANQLIEPSYISINSALYLHQKVQQIPFKVDLVCPQNSFFVNNKYKYHKINPKLFFGFEKQYLDSVPIFLATPEKAVIDGKYLNLLSDSAIKELLLTLNKKLLQNYLKKISKLRFKGKTQLLNFFEKEGIYVR